MHCFSIMVCEDEIVLGIYMYALFQYYWLCGCKGKLSAHTTVDVYNRGWDEGSW